MTKRVELSVQDMPEAQSAIRREIARMLREYADTVGRPISPEELRRLAAAFETGQDVE